MRFKQKRLGPLLRRHAQDPAFLSQVHVVIGGTGAVGGAEVLQLISIFEEARAAAGPGAASPRILVTARSKAEIRGFTQLLHRLAERDHRALPERVEGVGYRTPGGVLIDLRTFGIDPAIPELSGYGVLGRRDRARALEAFLAAGGLAPDAPPEARAQALERAVRERVATPLTDFLSSVAAELPAARGPRPLRAVSIGIPLASVATYKLGDLEAAAPDLGIPSGSARLAALKDAFVAAVVDDLAHVARELAEEVVVAHTTAVGGMYDEEDGARQIRLGFAHSAKGDLLRSKQDFARKLTELYSARGIKMLITAAAIGIDAILRRERLPTNGRVKDALQRANAEREDGQPPLVPEQELAFVRVHAPVELGLEHDPGRPVGELLTFSGGRPLVPERTIRSGENGTFSVPNADALYRVMRVTSSAELGLVLARVAAFGDDPDAPRFVDNVCYYTETDNSRQVFDLLADPPMLRDQLSGLSPKALQDLGSSKHQGELHTLGLLILLHRLLEMEVEAVPRYGDPSAFEPRAWFEQHSRDLTLERALEMGPEELARLLRALVAADRPGDLEPLLRRRVEEQDRELLHRVLEEVLDAVRAVPSLGSPILFEDERGRRRVRAGAYCAPLDQVLGDRAALGRGLHEGFLEHCRASAGACDPGDGAAWERWVEFHVASAGFVDLRPVAVVVRARVPHGDLSEQVEVLRDEPALRAALGRLEPYRYFTTSGLLALRVRLAGLVRMAREYDLSLGSANEYRCHLVHDSTGRALLVPGVVEAFRMVWEGLEKNTGSERLDGSWGYPRA